MNLVSKLRKKPKHVRDNIAFAAASVVTLPIMAYVVFGIHAPKLTNGVAATEGETKFFETFTSQFREQMASVREATAPQDLTPPGSIQAVIDKQGLDAVPVLPPATTSTSSRISPLSTATSSLIGTFSTTTTPR
jgi:hypothetical protein